MSEAAARDQTAEELKGDRGVLVLKQTLGTDVLQALFQFFKLAEIHDPSNDIFKKAIADVLKTLQTWIQIPEFGKLEFSLSGDQVFINEVRIRPKPRFIEKLQFLLKFMRKRRLTGFTIEKLPTDQSLAAFLWGLARSGKNDIIAFEQDLKDKDLQEFKLGTLAWKKDGESTEARSLATDLYHQFYEFVKLCFDQMDQAVKMPPADLDGMLNALQMVDEADLIGLFCMNTVKRPDRPLAGIAVNSAFMLYAWAKSLGLPSGVFLELAGAGLAHPLVLVGATKNMSTDIRSFARINLALSNLQRIKPIWQLTELQTIAILEWSIPFTNGGVYELGGQRCYPHFFSRMLRVVSVFQQTLMVQKDRTPEEAIAQLLKVEMGCDQTLVKLFVHWLGIYPVGTFVTLSSGETGQICSTTSDLLVAKRPTVGIYKDKDGNILDAPKIVDLNDLDGDRFGLGIVEGVAAKDVGIPPEKLAALSSMMSVSMSIS